MAKKIVTMNDIAERAGVSQGTVSLVLGKNKLAERLSPKTRERVLQIVEEMGYRRNAVAQAMATGRTYTIAFITWSLSKWHAARFLEGAMKEASSMGYHIRTHHVTGDMEHDRKMVQSLGEARVSGIIYYSGFAELTKCIAEESARYRIPVACLYAHTDQPNWFQASPDEEDGARQAVEHLHGLGHRRIYFVGSSTGENAYIKREKGWQDTMHKLGLEIPADAMLDCCLDEETHMGRPLETPDQALSRVLTKSPAQRPTALLCANDSLAAIAIRRARRLRLKIPEDLSIMGFGHHPEMEHFDPPISTVRQPLQRLGVAAMDFLLEQVEGTSASPMRTGARECILPMTLLLRESTGPVPEA